MESGMRARAENAGVGWLNETCRQRCLMASLMLSTMKRVSFFNNPVCVSCGRKGRVLYLNCRRLG